MMRRIFTVAAASALAMAVLAACGSGSSPGDTDAKGLTKLTVGIVPFSPDAVMFHAMDAGIFKKHGLEVKTEPAASPIAISAAMVSGKQQFGFITTPVLVNANLAGTAMKCVSPVDGQVNKERDSSALVTSKKSGITSLAGLAGKKFAVVQLGSINRLGAQKLFDDAGVKGVKYLAIPFPQMPQALADGRVDGAVITSPYVETAIDAGANVLAHPSSDIWPDGTIYCFAAMSKYLTENPKIAKAFNAAMTESITYAKDHEPEVLKSLVSHLKLSPKEAAAQIIPSNYVPEINRDSIASIQSEMEKQGVIKKTVNPDDLVWTPSS